MSFRKGLFTRDYQYLRRKLGMGQKLGYHSNLSMDRIALGSASELFPSSSARLAIATRPPPLHGHQVQIDTMAALEYKRLDLRRV